VFNDLRVYIGLFVLIAAAAAISRTSPAYLLRRVARFASLLVVAFMLPVLFNSGTDVLYHLGPVRITVEGVLTGTVFSLRILFLMLASSLLVRTTSPDALAGATARLLSPLRVFGLSETRTAAVLTQSWMAIPAYWEAGTRAIRETNFRESGTLKGMVPLLGDLIADLYLHVEPEPALLPERAEAGPGRETATLDV